MLLISTSQQLQCYVAVLALLIFSNGLASFTSIRSKSEHGILIQSLILSDSLYLGYMLLLLYVYLNYKSQFPLHSTLWMSSRVCDIATLLFATSLMQSKLTSFFIELNYLLLTKYSLIIKPLSRKKIIKILATVYCSVLILMCLFVVYSTNDSIYCMPFTRATDPVAWMIGIGVIGAFFLLGSLFFSMYSYCGVIMAVYRSAKKTGRVEAAFSNLKLLSIKAVLSVSARIGSTVGCVSLIIMHHFGIHFIGESKVDLYALMFIVPVEVFINPFVYTFLRQLKYIIRRIKLQ